MGRQRYFYHTESREFKRANWSLREILRLISNYVLIAMIVGVLMYVYMTYMFKSPEEKRVETENKEMESELVRFRASVAGLESQILELHRMDAEVYRTILSADPISASAWEESRKKQVGIQEMGDDVKNTKEELSRLENQMKRQYHSYQEILKAFAERKEEMKRVPSVRPVDGEIISGFGQRMNPLMNIMRDHPGLDFEAPLRTPIRATADGVVTFSGIKDNGYGVMIEIDHGFGYSTVYAHLNNSSVTKGRKVSRGDVIGYSGSTGLSKGPHLHYEILKNGRNINPIDYLYSDLDPANYVKFKKQAAQQNESMD